MDRDRADGFQVSHSKEKHQVWQSGILHNPRVCTERESSKAGDLLGDRCNNLSVRD